MLRRFFPLIIVGALSTLFIFVVFQSVQWRRLPQAVGLGEFGGPTEEEKANALPDLRTSQPGKEKGVGEVKDGVFREAKVENSSPYPLGETKPPGSNYTKKLVVSRMSSEDTSWIDEELGDMLDNGDLTTAIYTVDDPSAPLHPPKNKGHEVIVYLTYLIDFYDDLADINIFMHAHRFAWHNNELLDTDASLMIRHLSPERVTRQGYMNLRCHWDPGCPAHIHPGTTERDPDKVEEVSVAQAWAQLFPLTPIPSVLAQPCCAQFAVSRARIHETPKQRWVSIRDWILRTHFSDYVSGRVFEYFWQYIFTLSAVHCPSMAACYCDGYGFCFGGAKDLNYYFDLRSEHEEYVEQLRLWREQADLIEAMRQGKSQGGLWDEEARLDVPVAGRDRLLEEWIEQAAEEMEGMRVKAFERGRDPRQRALESGREWVEGAGF
ncbi:hypothetical protein B0A50_07288 [Salinomyces thailandicus]|uniref:Uncharacterized protein n=1 Tax=Salinomyces thailandicus TaxID=706561 RepID=A0A4U0TNQ6_9PEZI|nr:hypothetical protein B0A50_07288 [Salinomyces thailandica]